MSSPSSSGVSSAQVGIPSNKTDLTVNLVDGISREERYVLAAFQGVISRDGRKISAGAARDLIHSALTTLAEFDRIQAGK